MQVFDFTLFSVFLTVLSLGFGSFFNVVIHRMPQGKSVIWPPSNCPSCGVYVKWYDNIPVLSWIMLGGKCRSCKSSIAFRYLWVEITTGVLGVLSLVLFQSYGQGNVFDFLAFYWLVLIAVPIFVIDIKHFLIPDVLVLPGWGIGVLLAFGREKFEFTDALLGGIVSGGILFLFGWIMTKVLKKDALGFGDVKLIAMGGSIVGPANAYLALVIAAVLGLLITLPMKILKKEGAEKPLPFGPYIHSGLVICFLFGDKILHHYKMWLQGGNL